MALSASAIIVIVVCVSALFVTILWTFSGYYGRASTMDEAKTQISHEQDTYMRQVRQRNHEYAYAESIFGSGGASTTRTSQVWSNTNNGSTPNTPMATRGAGTPAWGAKRMDSNGKQSLSQSSMNVQQGKDGSRVNYSTYEPAEYFEQSPYESNEYYYGANERVNQVPSEVV
ncbi:hypothetical protein TSTA_103200 [Talaromyces stipitatus ATCC 10500]|uniref:Uncharacterized protein n=1 Tax=Talaromyces stipitatus (strain ATCC 10500 / CBS 375.48 / QM 6759 / NRRL 1006) TaxID=441959 RepID=B8MNK7_TALSN|nr:uncharacterized protein TSTA_103200 [Talaromyces stipitatus ATCC 10500]EED14095.1 hypothetical protein TSTA_103200 [Talaromyces stipitatus ATCC 10500]